MLKKSSITSVVSNPFPLHGHIFAVLLTQSRSCSNLQTRKTKRFRPHQLGGGGRKNSVVFSSESPTVTPSSSVHVTIDSFEPPSALSVDIAVEYLAALRGLHRSLGITPIASRVRWTARTFLQGGMPHLLANEPSELWTITENFACAVVVSCAHFEVSLSECPYSRICGEFLRVLWERRLLSSSCNCDEAVLLGQITLALLEQLSSRILCITHDDHLLWSQLLCETLLPTVMSLLQDKLLLVSPEGNDDDGHMSATQTTAFTMLLSSLTKAAVTHWARRGSASSYGKSDLVFGTPAYLLRHFEGKGKSLPAVLVTTRPLSLAKLAQVVQQYAASLSTPLQVKETALPVLRFLTLTQCVPLYIAPHDESENIHGGSKEEQEAHIKSLVLSCTRVLQASMEHRVVFVSHQLANVASIYARVLLFRSKENEGRGESVDKKIVVNSASWVVFENFMLSLQRQILYHVEALSPTSIMLQLCEIVTAFAKKYLFSDLAALLNAFSRVFRVIYERRIGLVMQEEQQEEERHCTLSVVGRDKTAIEQSYRDSAKPTHSRFTRRRTNAVMTETKRASMSQGRSASSVLLPSLLFSSVLSSSTSYFVVSSDDVAEIEGELEVLLDACVSVMERHMLSSCRNRPLFLMQEGGGSSSSSSFPPTLDLGNESDNITKVKDGMGAPFARIGASQAKALGGKSRFLKKVISCRELVMITEGVHALSWRPFMGFQERLLAVLSSELGQFELTSTQYACLVRLLLHSPPVLPSVIFYSVGDRLKRLIHAEAVTVPPLDNEYALDNSDIINKTVQGGDVVIAAAHARSLQDQPLSLHDACAILFVFTQKMNGTSLPLLHDLFARCGRRVLSESTLFEVSQHPAMLSALAMFVASASWALTHAALTTTENHVLRFIATSREHAACVLAVAIQEKRENGEGSVTSSHICSSTVNTSSATVPFLFSLRDLAYICMMLESCDSQSDVHVMQLRHYMRDLYMAYALQCDNIEVAQFLSDFLTIAPQETTACGDKDKKVSSVASLQLPSWMIPPLQLRERCATSKRLSTLMFLPFLGGSVHDDLSHALEVTRLYCRTFATLVTLLRLLRATDPALMSNKTVIEVVLRKVTQLTRRTSRPMELFQFFELCGDNPQIVLACLKELVADAQCFTASNAFVPVTQVNNAVKAVRRLRARALRQRWLATMTPLIISAVSFSREPIDVVLELTEHIGSDDPELLQNVLKSSACLQSIHETFSFTVSGDVLLRLLLQLQSSNLSHPTVRRLHIASGKLLQSGKVNVSLRQLAQTMLLPSVEGTTLGRRFKKLFVHRVERLFGLTRSSLSRLADSVEVMNDGRSMTQEQQQQQQRQEFYWDESLNQLELEHWLALLRFPQVGEPSSYRFLMSIKQNLEDASRKNGKLRTSTYPLKDTIATECSREDVSLSFGEDLVENVRERGVGMTVDKLHRSLAIVFNFSERTIFCLRRSLGAFGFITFVCELLRQTLHMRSNNLSVHKSSLYKGGCLYDGNASPLSDKRVWPFVRLANSLVEEMSTDLGSFLQSECRYYREWHRGITQSSERKKRDVDEKEREVAVDIGAVLEYLRVLDIYDPSRREQRLLLLSSSSSSRGMDVFDDNMQIPQRHLHRLLLQIPNYWGGIKPTSTTTSGNELICVRLQNISSVFDYCAAPSDYHMSFGADDLWAETRRRLSRIFESDRPLITDVWMPFNEVQSGLNFIDRTMKMRLFNALVCCLMRDGESLAVTRARFAALAPRDLAYIVQAFLSSDVNVSNLDNNNNNNGNSNDLGLWNQRKLSAVIAIELLTDMLSSTTAEDLHDVVMALLPPSLPKEQQDGVQSLTLFYGKEAAAEVRRFLAHVAVIMGNDTERFPLPLQFSILQRLHEPHRLIAPVAAQMMLTSLHAAEEDTSEPRQKGLQDSDGDSEGKLVENVTSRASNKGYYAATVALLRNVVLSSSFSSSSV